MKKQIILTAAMLLSTILVHAQAGWDYTTSTGNIITNSSTNNVGLGQYFYNYPNPVDALAIGTSLSLNDQYANHNRFINGRCTQCSLYLLADYIAGGCSSV